jgi:hypothetical protein
VGLLDGIAVGTVGVDEGAVVGIGVGDVVVGVNVGADEGTEVGREEELCVGR